MSWRAKQIDVLDLLTCMECRNKFDTYTFII